MKVLQIISATGYSLIAASGLVLGISYNVASKIMPYHLQAMDTPWNSLGMGPQWMLLNFERSVAAGFITTSVALILLLVFPFRRRDLWSYFGLFIIAITEWGNIAIRTASVKMNTAANPPLTPMIVLLSIALLSFILSLISYNYNKGGIQ